MKTQNFLQQHRAKLLPALILVAALVAGVIFRQQLVAWFSGDTVTSGMDESLAPLEAGTFRIKAQLHPDPLREKGNTLQLNVQDTTGASVEEAAVKVVYRMPPMGSMQEMRGEADIKEQGDGRYDAHFDLPMGGSWSLEVEVTKGNASGRIVFNVTVGVKGLTVTGADRADNVPATHAFNDATLAQLRQTYEHYEQVRSLLARDSIEGIDSLSNAMLASLDGAIGASADASSDLLEAKGAAQRLGNAADIAAARTAFADISKHLIQLAVMDSRLQEGLYLFECPMVSGFGKWFQRSARIENPYMGKQMLRCGEASQWPAPRETSDGHAHASGDDISHYTCSMHPSVKQPTPGQCPICGMDLTPVTKEENESGVIIIDEIRRQRIGVRTAPVERRALTQHIQAVGTVRYDETLLHDVNLRASGWVQTLIADKTGQHVGAGDTLFTFYSPEIFSAQLEHLTLLSAGQSDASARLISASRQRLHLFGMSDAWISELEQRKEALEDVPVVSPAAGYIVEKNIVEGARIEAGTMVYRIAGLERVWVDADLYERDFPHIRAGQSAEIQLPYVEGRVFEGMVDYIYPALDEMTRTARVRIVLDNPDLELKPDMYVNVLIEEELGERLAVPESAVIYTGPRRLVFLDLGEGRLRPKPVKLGVHVDGYYEITEGLAEGDTVVTSANFLIAAESRIRSAATYWEGSDDSR